MPIIWMGSSEAVSRTRRGFYTDRALLDSATDRALVLAGGKRALDASRELAHDATEVRAHGATEVRATPPGGTVKNGGTPLVDSPHELHSSFLKMESNTRSDGVS